MRYSILDYMTEKIGPNINIGINTSPTKVERSLVVADKSRTLSRRKFTQLFGAAAAGVTLGIVPLRIEEGTSGPPRPPQRPLVNPENAASPAPEVEQLTEKEKIAEAINGGVKFLAGQYDPLVGLLIASPLAEHKGWLNTDNGLASMALDAVKAEGEFVQNIKNTRATYGNPRHGVIEVLAGEKISWPPHIPDQQVVNGLVWNETRLSGSLMNDWSEYTDLAIYAALNAFNKDEIEKAKKLYNDAVSIFDGFGFPDKAFQDDTEPEKRYANFKLALAVNAGIKIGEKFNPEILKRLHMMQAEDGGFTTLSTAKDGAIGDANVETTSHTLMALSKVLAKSPSQK